MVVILSLAGLGAFLGSALLLRAGLDSMPVRYFVAAATGYLLFLGLVRGWLAYQRRRWSPDLDVPVDLEGGGGSGGVSGPPSLEGGGGSFGGGGASGSFGGPAPTGTGPAPLDASPDPAPTTSGGPFDFIDLDEAWPVAIGIVALAAGFLALGFVVYASPLLFAEVLLDAAVVGALYRRARRRSRSHWLQGVLRRTALPALALCAFLALAGFALQATNPEARSIGGVLRAGEP